MTSARIVVSLVPRDMDALERALGERAHRGADLVEVRLDAIAAEVADGAERFAQLLAGFGRPVIAALHGDEGFGGFQGGLDARRAALLAARAAGASLVDVDLRFAGALGDLGGPRILSSHDVAPDAAALDARAREGDELRADPGDLVKLVPAARNGSDALSVLTWLAARPRGGTIAFTTGAVGSFSRLLAPAYGAPLVYAAASASAARMEELGLLPAAPGQLSVEHVRRVWPEGGPGADTGLAAVCGSPIGHSASPVTHGAALRAVGADAMLVPIDAETLEDVMDFAAADPRWAGLSVTAPHKAVAARAPERDGSTAAIGAANTLVPAAGGGWRARNTDAPAVSAALREAGVALEGAHAVVVGAGGAAAAAGHALAEAGARVTIAARREEAAEALASQLNRGASAVELGSGAADALRPDVVVHATPVGTGGMGDAPVPDAWLRPGCAVLDAVYRPARTSLLRRAEARGALPVMGTRWFLHQALLQHVVIFRDVHGTEDAAGIPGERRDRIERAMAGASARWGASEDGAPPRAVCLVGLRGSGKTSVGRALAARLGAAWIDLDERVAADRGAADAAAVIEAEGLEGFRDAEERALAAALTEAREAGPGPPLVISAGGGIVERAANLEALADGAFCAWLRAPLERLRARVATDDGTRRPPLVDGAEDEFTVLDRRRAPRFDRIADVALDTGGREIDELAAALAGRLGA